MSNTTITYQDTDSRERRHFKRIEVRKSGEFVWSSKPLIGRSKTLREFVTTQNLAVKGAKIIVPGQWEFKEGDFGRFKLATEFCDAQVLEATSNGVSATLRLVFIGPSEGFIAAVTREQATAAGDDRFAFAKLWS